MLAMMLDWSFEPYAVLSLAAAVGWYVLGLLRMYRRLGSVQIAGKGRVAAFFTAMLTLVIALMSPIDTIGEQLFSVHMVQHLLLILAAAPLLAWCRPAIVFLWALPLRARKGVGRAWSGVGLRAGLRCAMNPVVAWTLFSGSFVFWHFPGPYGWALRNEAVHTLEHICLFVPALMFWTIVFEPEGHRRLGYGATLLFVTTTGVLSGLPGALIFLSPRPLYPVAASDAAAWHISLLQDQQLAGLIMWVPAGFLYIAVGCFVFVKWLAEAEPRTVRRLRGQVLTPLIVVTATMLVSGCKDHGGHAIAAQIGNPDHGARLIQHYGCGSCHLVPGIAGADGVVGPPLIQIGRRIYVAGMLRNTPDNLTRWVRNPQQIVPGNAMPDMGLSEADARDVAAYLYTLR